MDYNIADSENKEPIPVSIENMSKRELLIAFSLCGILSNPNNSLSMELNIDFAQKIADALIKRLNDENV